MRDDWGTDRTRRRMPESMAAAAAWAAGLCAGAWGGDSWMWLAAAGIVGALALWVNWTRAKPQAAPGSKLVWWVVIALTAAGWWGLRERPSGLEQQLGERSELVDVEGVVVEGLVVDGEEMAGLAKFMFHDPRTRWVIAVDRAYGEQVVRTSGRLLVSMPKVDTRALVGDRVRCQGWAAAIGPPMNPGQSDARQTLGRAGIVGRLWLAGRSNMRIVERGDGSWRAMRDRWMAEARGALNSGIAKPQAAGNRGSVDDGNALAFVDALVLGQRRAELDQVYPAFRSAGLAHVLSISGLHVGLVVLGAWLLGLAVTGRPRWAAGMALIAVLGYVWMVPWKVPIVRAGFMATALCMALTWGRRMRSDVVLGWTTLAWLMLRPGDVFDAGFQLSYGVVAGLLLWTDGVTRWILPAHLWSTEAESWVWPARRWAARYLAAAVVAWGVAMPIVMHQFGMANVLAVLIGTLALPVLAGVLWLGLAKVVIGMLWPAAGAAMGGALLASGKAAVALVSGAAKLPGAAVDVPAVSAWWTIAALAVVAALFSGWFARRAAAFVACMIVLGVGLFVTAAKPQAAEDDALRCTALAVSDGSCFVIQSGGRTWLFDCGSRQRPNVGKRVAAPALAAMGVDRLDTIVISHGDFDHFSGVLEVCDALPVSRIVTGAGLIDDAQQQPRGATAALLTGLQKRHVPVEVVAAGWRDRLGDGSVEALWPPAGVKFDTNNDGSVVLRFTVQTHAGAKRLMLNGDIQTVAMSMMQQQQLDVRADVTDLPHHGSFPPGVLDWLARAAPRIVIQSTSPRKLNWDNWADHIAGIERLITARQGAITVRFHADGSITADHFADTALEENPMADAPDGVLNAKP